MTFFSVLVNWDVLEASWEEIRDAPPLNPHISYAMGLHCVARPPLLARNSYVVCDSRPIVELNVEQRQQDTASAWSRS
jgi:hypothetical protein